MSLAQLGVWCLSPRCRRSALQPAVTAAAPSPPPSPPPPPPSPPMPPRTSRLQSAFWRRASSTRSWSNTAESGLLLQYRARKPEFASAEVRELTHPRLRRSALAFGSPWRCLSLCAALRVAQVFHALQNLSFCSLPSSCVSRPRDLWQKNSICPTTSRITSTQTACPQVHRALRAEVNPIKAPCMGGQRPARHRLHAFFSSIR